MEVCAQNTDQESGTLPDWAQVFETLTYRYENSVSV